MKKIRFDEFLKVVEYAPITPMQALELFSIVYRYMEAYRKYCNAEESNSQTMAFWDMKDLADEYEKLRRKLACSIPPLENIRHSIY